MIHFPLHGTEYSTSGFLKRAAGQAARGIAVLFFFSIISVFLLRFIPPVTSAFMLEKYCKDLFASGRHTSIEYRWTPWKKISPRTALAVVASEDQIFPEHFGFDFKSISKAMEDMEEGDRVRGASTISQQVAKNLFLWKGKSFVRKGLEAYFTVLMEALWPKRRILEVYLNVAEFGDGIYGVNAAAKKYFGKAPADLTERESALLAAVLPNPKKLKAAAPSAYVKRRMLHIEKQMQNLGQSYLKDIWNDA